MNIKIFSVFSGLGKTFVGNKYQNVCDLQSSPYRYDYSSVSKGEYEKIKYEQKHPIHESAKIYFVCVLFLWRCFQ